MQRVREDWRMAIEAEPMIPAITGEQMAKVDQIMMGELGLDVLQVMELAGWAVAAFARERFLGNDPRGRRVLVLAGSGGNGGDGMVAARHLHGWGGVVTVQLAREPHPQGAADHQLRVLRNLEVAIRPPGTGAEAGEFDLMVDGMLGFSLQSAPCVDTKSLIEWANTRRCPLLAIDLPSGLGASDGTVFDPCVRADATLTLGLPKTGLLSPSAAEFVGDLFVADIGVPAAAYAGIGIQVDPIFAHSFWRPVRRQSGTEQGS
jgi:NAD(P)H-hydrate epimerase